LRLAARVRGARANPSRVERDHLAQSHRRGDKDLAGSLLCHVTTRSGPRLVRARPRAPAPVAYPNGWLTARRRDFMYAAMSWFRTACCPLCSMCARSSGSGRGCGAVSCRLGRPSGRS
jgi:hypothetical protein